jgi:hypothetical protein
MWRGSIIHPRKNGSIKVKRENVDFAFRRIKKGY